MKTLHLIYDGHCKFCVRSLGVVRALDVRDALCFHDSHRDETFEWFPDLNGADVEEAMYALAEGERPQRGFYAFRRVAWAVPPLWPLLPFFYLPGASFIGERAYAWVARNRKSFGCESNLCGFPAGDSRGNSEVRSS